MDVADGANWLLIPLQILVVDVLLGADNALVIALACRSLRPEDMRRAAAIGIGGAIVIRLAMTVAATWLLALPLLKLSGALALIWIAMNISEGEAFDAAERAARPAATNLWAAAGIIIFADAAMGLDNVVALAAIARGNFWLLAIGVALSLPVLGFGGVLLTDLLKRAPGLARLGAALLGWIAGGMAISDRVIAPWAEINAPGLVAIAPWLGAAFIYLHAMAPSRAGKSARCPPSPPEPGPGG